MPRQVFYGRTKPLVGTEPLVSLQRKVFSLNKAARELLGPIQPDDDQHPIKVELSYDPDAKIVGMQRVDSDDLHLYPVRRSQGSGDVWVVSSAAFFRAFKIPHEGLRRYRATVEETEDGPILLVDLSEQNRVAKYSRGLDDGRIAAK